MELDVVTVGGATVDLFLLIDPTNPSFKFNQGSNELAIHLGDKIVLDKAKFTVGGNAANVAVGVKRLGFTSAIFAEIGKDEFTDRIIRGLKKEGTETKFIKKNGTTSFSIVLNYKDDRTIFTEKFEKEHDFSFRNLETKWVYLTSLGKKWEGAYKKVHKFVKDQNIKLAFNPGGAQINAGLSSFEYILPDTELLILNKEEAEKLVGKKDTKDLLFDLKKLGPTTVVITDGEKGSYAVDDRGEVVHEEALRVKVFSRTGAGDAYSSGFLGGVLSGKELKECMRWGTKNSASVVKLIGAQTGLMHKGELS